MHIVDLRGLTIFEQLQIEEALLRTDKESWVLLNTAAPPAIVMGISGKPERLLNLSLLAQNPTPVIKRFSGGGTVIINPDTIFATLICSAEKFSPSPFPKPIMEWTSELYGRFFQHPLFSLKENDYVFGHRKCGGNAQYIQKNRWLHHTSFLWDYSLEQMDYLQLPEKRPSYRQDRSHTDFLCRLKEYYSGEKESFYLSLKAFLCNEFHCMETSIDSLSSIRERSHRKSTHLLSL